MSPDPKMIQYDPKMIQYFYSSYTVQYKNKLSLLYSSRVALNSSVDFAPTTLKGSAFQLLINSLNKNVV